MDQNQIREQNIAKYGEKSDDVIARCYREGKAVGDIWCLKNAEKYMRRFLTTSQKGNNLADLIKAQDYINRAVEENRKFAEQKQVRGEEIIEKY